MKKISLKLSQQRRGDDPVLGLSNPKLLLRALSVLLLFVSISLPISGKPLPKAKAPTKAKAIKPTPEKPGPIKALVEAPLMEASLGHARTYYRRHNYRAALLSLGDRVDSIEALFIAAESSYRLGKYADATRYFEQIVQKTEDPIERRKAAIRLFDVDVKANNTQSAIDRYVAFTKEYKKPSANMRYSLGKLLYDIGYFERAENVLRRIQKGNEFYMRARYILAAISLDKKKPSQVVKLFSQIEAQKPVSAEDYTVRELAILAQGRIYADMKKEDLAAKAYSRVNLSSEFGETATIEMIRTWLARASEARLGEGRFKNATAFRRELVEKGALSKAEEIVLRYRKVHEIDWHSPELLTLMAELFVRAKRYEDGRLAYQELIDHYRPLHEKLKDKTTEEGVWPYFALRFHRDLLVPHKNSIVPGVPNALIADLPKALEILSLRDSIEVDEAKLRELEEWAKNSGVNDNNIEIARAQQTEIVNAYNAMVIKKQNRFKEIIAETINNSLAEALFKRAELAVLEMADLRTQQTVVQDYQTEQIDAFDSKLKKLDEGAAP